MDCGTLSFPDIIEAYSQFLTSNEIDGKKEECKIRMMIFQAYNDYYYRNKEEAIKLIDSEHHKLFVETGLWLIRNHIHDDLLKAEFYREIGETEKSKEIITKLEYKDEFLKKIASEISKRLEEGDCRVFQIY